MNRVKFNPIFWCMIINMILWRRIWTFLIIFLSGRSGVIQSLVNFLDIFLDFWQDFWLLKYKVNYMTIIYLNLNGPSPKRFLISNQADGSKSDNITTGLHQRIRRKFDNAFERFPRCVLLWRMYLAFEKKMENETNFESIFYRATDNLPHVKVDSKTCF